MDDFGNLPGNSHSAKIQKEQQDAGKGNTEATESSEEPKQVKKVVNGKVTTRKKSLATQMREMFASDDGEQSFIDYLLNDVAVPMVQETIISIAANTLDGIKYGIEHRITGGRTQRTPPRTTSYGTGRPVTNYNAPYRSTPTRPSVRSVTSAAPTPRVTIRRSNRVQDIILTTREDGLDALDELRDKVRGFGHCTVGDLYTVVGETPVTTDHEWGWDDLSDARVRRLGPGEFQLVLPRPIEIEFES